MKVITGLFLTLLLASFTAIGGEKPTPPDGPVTMTDDVKALVDNSCYGCHNSEATNERAVRDLNFDVLDSLTLVQKIGALNHIAQEVGEKKMPPARFLENNPDKALSDEDIQTLTDWVQNQIGSLARQPREQGQSEE